jgi:alanyl-tRNA synthetase
MAEERGWTVDLDGFQQLMNEQKERSRKKSSGSGNKIVLQAEQTDHIAKTISASATDDSGKYAWVSMGTGKPLNAKVLAVWTGKEFKSSATDADGTVGVLLDRTNFYAEEGGQEFDTGAFTSGDASFDVSDTQKFGPYVLHIGTASGSIAVGAEVECSPDFIRRHRLAANHTMTHVCKLLLLLLLISMPTLPTGSQPRPSHSRRPRLQPKGKRSFNYQVSVRFLQLQPCHLRANRKD